MNTLTHKGWGRIYTDKPENIEKIEAIIKELDEFEFEYLPEGLITVSESYPAVVYLHKFSDMDMDTLTAQCWKRGIMIWVFDAGHTEYPSA